MAKYNKSRKRNIENDNYESLEYILAKEKFQQDEILQDISNMSNINYRTTFANKYNMRPEDVTKLLASQLADKLKKHGLIYKSKEHYPLPNEIKYIIRLDFFGVVRNYNHNKHKEDHNLKIRYNKFTNPENTKNLTIKDYDLNNSPTWNIFRQFRGFKLLENKLKKRLIKEGIHPKSIKHLNAYDYSTLLYNATQHERENTSDYESVGAYLGIRCRFIKHFIRNNEEAFRQYLKDTNVNDDYANCLIRVMKKRGITASVDVIEEYYSAESIRRLKENNIELKGAYVGSFITREHRQILRAHNKLDCIIIFDKNGEKIKGPEFSVHHKVAVKDSGQETNFSDVNLFNNLCLIVEPYHDFAHSLDKTEKNSEIEKYVGRIEFEKNIIFFGGFNKRFKIFYHQDISKYQKASSEKIVNEYIKNEEIEAKNNGQIANNKPKRKSKYNPKPPSNKSRRERKIEAAKRRRIKEGR